MKESDKIVYVMTGIGAAISLGVWIVWPNTPWWIYLCIGLGMLLAIPEAIKNAAEQKIAKKILDE